MTTPEFDGGANIAMKIPKVDFERTVAFYRDVLGMPVTRTNEPGVSESARVLFGPVTLWLDRVDNYPRADMWLELHTPDVAAATQHLCAHGVHTQDELEPLSSDFDGHWITNPVGITHLVRRP